MFQRRHMVEIAATLAAFSETNGREYHRIVNEFAKHNPNFDPARFRKACGLTEE